MTTTKNKNYWFDVTNAIVPEFKTFKEIYDYCIEKLGMKYFCSIETYSLKTLRIYINEDFQVVLLPENEKVDDFYNFFNYFYEGDKVKKINDLVMINLKQHSVTEEHVILSALNALSVILNHDTDALLKCREQNFKYREQTFYTNVPAMVQHLCKVFFKKHFYFEDGTRNDVIEMLIERLHQKGIINGFEVADDIIKNLPENASVHSDTTDKLLLAKKLYFNDTIKESYNGFLNLSPYMAFFLVLDDVHSIENIIQGKKCSDLENTFKLLYLLNTTDFINQFKPSLNGVFFKNDQQYNEMYYTALFLHPKEVEHYHLSFINELTELAGKSENQERVLENVIELIGSKRDVQQTLLQAYLPYCGNQELIELYSLD